MKNARRLLAGFYFFISLISLISLSGCLVGDYRGDNRGYNRGDNGEERHYYRDGRWYRRDPSGVDIFISALFTGALIESLPPRHTTVVVEGDKYYHDDRYYYKQRPQGGYVVVPEPARGKSESRGRQEKGDDHNQGNRGENR
jgi:hypothetical protein